MAARHYLAVIERAAEGYGVFFPDLPGCTSGGATLEEAAVNAEDALRGHVEVSVEEGQALPAPSSLDDVHVDPDIDEAARLLVRVDMPGAAVRVNITVADDVLAAVDRHVEREGFTRSGFFTQAVQEKMKRDRAQPMVFDDPAGVVVPRSHVPLEAVAAMDPGLFVQSLIKEVGRLRLASMSANARARKTTGAASAKRTKTTETGRKR